MSAAAFSEGRGGCAFVFLVNDAAKNTANVETHVRSEERETVRQLKLQGWSISAIASRLGRSPTEVELLLELPID